MLVSKSKISQIVCLTGVILAIDFLCFSNSLLTQAKSDKKERKSYEGIPSNRRDGGSRGNCIASEKDFIALVPEKSINLTASVNSRLFFYVPQTDTPKTIEFVLRNSKDQLVHETFIETSGRAGITSVAIPAQAKRSSQESQGDYRWYLSMICDPNERSRDIVLEGWIKYLELNNSLKEKIKVSSSLEKFNLFQQQGVWYDALSVVAESQKSESNLVSIQTQWSQLLESIGLGDLASEPLIEAKKINNFFDSTPVKAAQQQ